MYKNIIFDLYGTLIDINTNEDSFILWKKLSLFYSLNGACYKASDLKKCYETITNNEKNKINFTKFPDIQIENIFKMLYEIKNVHPSTDLVNSTAKIFRALSIKYIKLYDGVLNLLYTLKNNNKKVYLLSNAQNIFTLNEIKMLDIYKYFDKVYFSSDYLMCKPEKSFFEVLLKDCKLNKNESIMIGNDSLCDISGAYNAGIDSIYIHSNLSPKDIDTSKASFTIMDGDVNKLLDLLIN